MKLDEFDYDLPREAIAQEPFIPRDHCRLLVLHKNGKIEHRIFHEVVNYLQEGDIILINTTSVLPARLIGNKKETGGKVEIFLLKRIERNRWQCLLKPFKKVKEGKKVIFPETNLEAKIIQKGEKNTGIVDFKSPYPVEDNLFKVGQVPLPPYIKRKKGPTCKDKEGYQTVYAREPGAVAAPTAGLHFTPQLLKEIKRRGVQVAELILHTGWASFFSLEQQEVEKNRLPGEYFKIPPSTAKKVNHCRGKGGKVVAVGTTTVRAVETNFSQGHLLSGEGWTDLFIYPGYKFKIVDALITNFHMPHSSLLLLVSALTGKQELMSAYKQALDEGYRFLSYGDAMLTI